MADDVEEARRQIKDLNVKQNHDPNDLDEESQEKYNACIVKAKRYIGEGRIEDALRLNKRALAICHSDKLARKIQKMEDYLKTHDDESEDEAGMTHLGKGFYLYKELHDKLYVHQQEGVLWLWSLYRQKKGGILGDDMGLGKTIQVIAFLSGMFDMQKINSVLIVLPVAVMVNWENECKKWSPGLKVVAYHGNSKREKEKALARVQKRGGICFTTYGLVVTSFEQLGTQDGREFVWDYMILDEGHKIKNPTKTSKGVHAIPAKNRIILTGTPVQNNLKELWALFDFVHQGSLLGTQRTFKMEYDNPITRAREKDATSNEKRLGMEMAQSLKAIISPFFLRRTKAEVKEREKQGKKEDTSTAKHAVMPTMTRKNDLIAWTFLSKAQLQIYTDFLHLDTVKELLMTSKSPLVALNVLKKICDHPRLLSTRACSQLGIEDEELDDELLETETGNLSAVTRIQHIADHVLINESGKLTFLVKLLDRLKEEGHRCLVFSQSRKMLDIMQKVMTNRGHKIMRLDGTISQVHEREQRIKKFQSDSSYSVFLLTTQVGGVGLTLTAADRVVIYDPSWNPATDAQAVDRVFRIGQNKNVVIYRLITCGTVEEKIYRRQVFKDSITRQTTGNAKNPYRYFSKYELRELFTMNDPTMSTTQQQLEEMHSGQRLTDPSLDEHIAFLYSLDMFGLSDHDLMFSQATGRTDDMSDEEQEVEATGESDYIQHRVQKAQELLQLESQQGMGLEERQGKYQGPAIPGVTRTHLWDFPKPQQQEVDQEQSDPSGSVPSDNEEEESNTSSQSADKHSNITIDLTSPVAQRHVKTEKPKDDCKTDTIDLTTPVIKQENFQNGITEAEEEIMEINDTPKKHNYSTPIKSKTSEFANGEEEMQIGGDTPKHNLFNDKHANGEGIKPEPLTPRSKIVREGLLISPEPSKPLLQTVPFKTGSPRRANLNTTLFGNIESPDVGSELHQHRKAPVRDTPANRSNSHVNVNAIVEDSPNISRTSVGGLSERSGRSKSSTTAADVSDNMKDSMANCVINESMINDSVINDSVANDSMVNDSMVNDSMVNDSVNGSVAGDSDTGDSYEMEHPVPSHKNHKYQNGHERRDIKDAAESDEMDQGDISVHEVKEILEKSLAHAPNGDMGDGSEDDSCDDVELDESDMVPVKRSVKSRRSISARKPVIESSDDDDVDNDDDDDDGESVNSDNEENVISDEYDVENGKASEGEKSDLDNIGDDEDDDDDDDDDDNRESNLSDRNNVSKGELNESNNDKSVYSQNESVNMERDYDTDKRPDIYANGRDLNHDADKRLEIYSNGRDVDHHEGGRVNGQSIDNDEAEADDQEDIGDEEYSGESEEEEEGGFDDLPEESQLQYNELVDSGRSLCQQKRYEDGLSHVLQALEIYPDPELQATAVNIQKKIMRKQMKGAI